MYKIFVVEDEPLIRQSLRTAIETGDGPYQFCGEAGDGEMALSMMMDLQPDILITDIKMPFMDGLELARLASETLPWLKTIIVSGHDEFGYAQQAISIGVDQYLLKPIRQAELLEAVDATIQSIEAQQQRNTLSSRYDERDVEAALFRQLMHHILFGDLPTARIIEESKPLGINLMHTMHQVVAIQLEDAPASPDAVRGARELLLGRLGRDVKTPGIFVVPNQLAFLVSADSKDALSEESYTAVRIVLHDLETSGVRAVTVLSEPVPRLSAVCEAYSSVDAVTRFAGHLYSGQILDLSDRAQVPAVSDAGTGAFRTTYGKKLQFADTAEMSSILADFLDTIDANVLQSRIGRYQILLDIYSACLDVVRSEDGDTGSVPPALGGILDLVDASSSRESFDAFTGSLLADTVRARQNSADVSTRGGVIQQAVEFIKENYNNPDISLHLVSNHVGFSPAHFSMVFSQRVGRTFIDYLTGVRIDKAKELLLTTDRKLASIAAEVGYNEPNYFSYVFKKRAGVSPKEFRSRSLRAAGTDQ